MKRAAHSPAIGSVGVLADGAFVFRERRGDLKNWDLAEELECFHIFEESCVMMSRRHVGVVEVRMQILCRSAETMMRRSLLVVGLECC